MGVADVRSVAATDARGSMRRSTTKLARFAWRASRNLICAVPGGSQLLFPPTTLAHRFGRDDVEYALNVYRHHRSQLARAGFKGAAALLEVGPGRNLGTSLLWWSWAIAEGRHGARVLLWDVHRNAQPEAPGFWSDLADQLLKRVASDTGLSEMVGDRHKAVLAEVRAAQRQPDIEYLVCPIEQFETALDGRVFDLVSSHAALEHVWWIDKLWRILGRATAPDGWHSHRIDLADHGRRSDNYLEMLEWSPTGWWLTMRFTPGAINRWRAAEHEAALVAQGVCIRAVERERRAKLPVPRCRLARRFRDLSEEELTTTAIDIVGLRDRTVCTF